MMVWLNGEWKEEGEAAVAADDGAFLRGEGVFETMLGLGGRAFQLARHWERFAEGCGRFSIELLGVEEAEAILGELLERNGFGEDERVRLRVTRSRESLLFSAQAGASYPEKLRLRTTPYRRNERGALVGVKAISYGENAVALAEGRSEGADEVLFANTKKEWCEGAWSNVFAVEEGRIVTPPLSSGCLPGVTREVVIELARKAGIDVVEEARSIASLGEVEEIFLTSSLLGVGAVREFDGRVLEKGTVATDLARLLGERELDKE